ncbi:MAG TPA: hypothetical protein VFH51_09065, partial [Myxococcota bacterium]|nr:hypothetical protein [Myxococcota bacterium]
MRRRALPLWVCLAGLGPATTALAAEPASPILTPPVAVTPTQVAPPPDAPPLAAPVVVRVLLTLDADGEVSRVALLEGPVGPWSEAVLVGATYFHFTPARLGDTPVAVDLEFRQEFLPQAPPPAAPEGELRGTLLEKG